MAASVWNPADLANVTLANNSLTATGATTSAGVRATQGQAAGKYYFEITTHNASGSNTGLGVANASASLAGMGAAPTNAALVYGSGNIYVNNANSGKTLPFASVGGQVGNTVGLALDLDNKLIWFIIASDTGSPLWNATSGANPATATGGLSIAAIAGSAIFPAVSASGIGARMTLNCGATPFARAAPAGFVPGFPTSTVQATNGTTWNPSDKLNFNLVAGNLVSLTINSVAGGVRSISAKSSGKSYFEALQNFAGAGTAFGVVTASANLGTVAATPNNAAILYGGVGGNIWVNNTPFSTLAPNNGDVLGCALDMDLKLIWFRIAPSGAWNASGIANPATATGGYSISALSGPIYALATATAAAGTNSGYALNFGDSPFVGAVPASFASGFPGLAIPAAAQARVMVLA